MTVAPAITPSYRLFAAIKAFAIADDGIMALTMMPDAKGMMIYDVTALFNRTGVLPHAGSQIAELETAITAHEFERDELLAKLKLAQSGAKAFEQVMLHCDFAGRNAITLMNHVDGLQAEIRGLRDRAVTSGEILERRHEKEIGLLSELQSAKATIELHEANIQDLFDQLSAKEGDLKDAQSNSLKLGGDLVAATSKIADLEAQIAANASFALLSACIGIDEDYMSSGDHHAGYILIPTARFEAIRRAVRAKVRQQEFDSTHTRLAWHAETDALKTGDPAPEGRTGAVEALPERPAPTGSSAGSTPQADAVQTPIIEPATLTTEVLSGAANSLPEAVASSTPPAGLVSQPKPEPKIEVASDTPPRTPKRATDVRALVRDHGEKIKSEFTLGKTDRGIAASLGLELDTVIRVRDKMGLVR